MLYGFGTAFVAIFIALDVIGMLPLFISMTFRLSHRQRDSVVNTSVFVALSVAIAFVFVGEAVFRYLGIALFDFKIAGGLVLLLISLADLVGSPEPTNRATGSTGIVPLAVPLITGPAMIATLVYQVHSVGYVVTMIALLANYLFAWIVLKNSQKVTRLIGKDGTVVISKVVALLLAAIAVSMIRSGLFGAIQDYASLAHSLESHP